MTIRIHIIIDGIPTTIRGKTVNDLVEHAIARALSAIDSADRISSAKKDADRTPTTFQGYTEHFLNEFKFGKRSGTYIKELRGYFSNYLLPFFGKTPLCQIRTCDIQQMLDSILSVKKPGHELCKKTKKDILAFLGMILDSAQEDGIVMNNPAKSKRLIIGGQAERIIPSWEEEEWTILFYKVLPSLKLQQDRLFLLLDMFHGLRKSEIAALTWNNIDLEKGTINITTSVQWATVDGASNQGRIKEPKTQNGIREIVISQFVLPYLREANKSKTYLIYGTRYPAKTGDKPPSFSVLESIIGRIRTACEACGIKHKYRTHELRHTVITFDCNAGVDDKSLANNHGHFSAEFGKKQYARSLSTQRIRARKKTDDYLATLLQPKSIE